MSRRLISRIVIVFTIAGLAVLLVFSIQFFPQTLSAIDEQFVWCYDKVTDKDGATHSFGHPPSVNTSRLIESIGTKVESACFETWSAAAFYITNGQVKLPDDATEQDYVNSVGVQK